ncbi:MAG: hypothetical protein CL798_05675 [Chromatiales bacterium]|nr:hypothetical protein [Chromatiales bacterium]
MTRELFYVGINDAFPGLSAKFPGLPGDLRKLILAYQIDLLTTDIWHDLKSRYAAKQWVEVIPYGDRLLNIRNAACI